MDKATKAFDAQITNTSFFRSTVENMKKEMVQVDKKGVKPKPLDFDSNQEN